jgi:hypothetical protein
MKTSRFAAVPQQRDMPEPRDRSKYRDPFAVVSQTGDMPQTGRCRKIRFDDGVTVVVNLDGALQGELYGPLKDPSLFERVKLDEETGNLVWPKGADFDPEILHEWRVRRSLGETVDVGRPVAHEPVRIATEIRDADTFSIFSTFALSSFSAPSLFGM